MGTVVSAGGPDELNQIQQLEYRQKRLMSVLETMVRLAPRAVSPSTYSMDSDIFMSSPISSQDSIAMALPEAEHGDESQSFLLCEGKDNQELNYCQPRVVIPGTIATTDSNQVPTSDLASADITTNERLLQTDSLDTEDSEADVGSVSTKRQRLSGGAMKQNPKFIFRTSQLQLKLSKSSRSTHNKPQMERTSGQRKTLKFISYTIKTTAYPSVEAELRRTRVRRHDRQLRKAIAVHQNPAEHPHSHQQEARKYSNIVIEVPPRRPERKKMSEIVIEIPPWI